MSAEHRGAAHRWIYRISTIRAAHEYSPVLTPKLFHIRLCAAAAAAAAGVDVPDAIHLVEKCAEQTASNFVSIVV
jgi:hypothetical protein